MKNKKQPKQKIIDKLNDKIDNLIIRGKVNTEEFKRLTKLHKQIVFGN